MKTALSSTDADFAEWEAQTAGDPVRRDIFVSADTNTMELVMMKIDGNGYVPEGSTEEVTTVMSRLSIVGRMVPEDELPPDPPPPEGGVLASRNVPRHEEPVQHQPEHH